MVHEKTTAPPATTDIVAGWLAAETIANADCQVARAIQTCTNAMKLDEAELLTQLRRLGEPEEGTHVPR